MPTLLYLHGFNSSPESKKAQQTRQWFEHNAPEIEFVCPSLPPYADAAISLLEKLINERRPDQVYLIGSSMGGFFATTSSNVWVVGATPDIARQLVDLVAQRRAASHACVW